MAATLRRALCVSLQAWLTASGITEGALFRWIREADGCSLAACPATPWLK